MYRLVCGRVALRLPRFARIVVRRYADPPKGWEHFPQPKGDKVKKEKKDDSDDGADEDDKDDAQKEFQWPPFVRKASQKEKKENRENKKKDDDEDGEDAWNEMMANDTMKSAGSKMLMLTAAVLTVVGGVLYFGREKSTEITFIQFQNELLASGFIDHVDIVNKNKVRVYLKGQLGSDASASPYYLNISNPSVFEDDLHEAMAIVGLTPDQIPINYIHEAQIGRSILVSMPSVISVGVLIYLIVNLVRGLSRRVSSGSQSLGGLFSIGKSTARLFDGKGKIKVTFKDVAGCDEAKQEVTEFVSFLKSPTRYTQLGAKIPKGALLVGPPGTGKTLLAKAMAGEAEVPFYSVSGSDFIEVFGGVGSSRVRDLFKQARRNAPCIIFVDEIDAIGRRRGGSGAMRNEERENTLNQLLVEMDGFEANTGIVVLAGTNRPDILDPALTRPGRFDRRISIDLPDIRSRQEIFEVHLKKIKTQGTIADLAPRLAALSPGFSGADIANVCNEAALIAARHKKTAVEVADFEAAIDRVLAGLEKKSRVLSPDEKTRVAYHEAGHALVGWLLPHTDPVLKVSIIPRGQAALGFSMQLPEERYIHSIDYLKERICVLLAGRAAEIVKFNEISSGAQDDLEKVTDMAYAIALQYGMNPNIGTLAFSERNNPGYMGKPFSDAFSEKVDVEVRALVKEQFERTINLVQEKRDKLEEIARQLLEKEVIQQEDVERILGPKVMAPLPVGPHEKGKKENQDEGIVVDASKAAGEGKAQEEL